MIYVPTFNNGNCVVVSNYETIRVYERQPSQNSTISYIDYYIRSNYISYYGTASFSQYSAIPSCRSDVTTNFLYRYDIDKIFICVFIIFFFINFFVIDVIKRVFGRWLKV